MTEPDSPTQLSRAQRRRERPARAAKKPGRAARAASPTRRRHSALRAAVAVSGVAVAVAVAVVPRLVPFPLVSRAVQGVVVTPVAANSTLVCGGDLINASEPEELRALGGSRTVVWPANATTDSTTLREPDVAAPGSRMTSVSVPPHSVPTPGGITTQAIANETISGLSARTCAEPSAESWLVAGSTDVGRTSVVVLANPSKVTATVDLQLYGESGALSATGATGLTVPAGSVRALSLAGLAPNVVKPVVRMTARGGEIAASLQSSAISGLTPQGVEVTGPSAAPATVTVISGFTVASPPATASSDDGSGGPGAPTLRLLAPGDSDSTVSIEVANEDPSGVGTSAQVVVAAGRVVEVPLAGLGQGSYRVTLNSDQPIVASGRSTSTGSAGTDFAWFVSGTATAQSFGVGNTGEPGARLHLANASNFSASITMQTAAGSRTLQLGPFAAASTEIGTDSLVVSSDQPMQASLSIAAEGRIASAPIVPPGPLSSPITVYSH
ncbi:DUF5719 family protein [Rathayibacter toxicus]|uniref:DUF5719 family protein n=1 Tax=Rathayibacter toxicus TaxID=145458 RepID=UPI000CE762B5|nr:DUF5719 family protein [Rathayibacter toxicus]PPI53017.1 hypothetical protein C5D35_08690 [Rathayibacter toxicus]QOD10902.1 hypothetical protein BSG36_02765 [Rathayibacter toxicus]QWL29769.1 hypothetical protein E2R34_02720 [Rathayibacter toxicus]